MLDEPVLTGAKARRQRVREEMRDAIVESARRIVDRDGFEALTIRAVAQDLGYSAGALYEYFDSKDLILRALYFEGTGGLGAHCEHAVSQLPESSTPMDALAALGHAYRAYALDHAELYRLVFCGLRSRPKPPEAASAAESGGGFGLLVRIAQDGVSAGQFVDLPAPVIATAAWSAVHGFVSMEVGGQITGGEGPGRPIPPPAEARQRRDDAYAAVIRMVLRGLASEEHTVADID